MKKFCFLFINSLFLVSGILASETDYTKGQYIRFHYAIGKSEYVLELQPDAGPWLATHIWEYYDYTRDLNFLKETGYELIKSSADFEVDMIWENNQSKEATVRSGAGGNCVIKYGNKMLSFKNIKGQSYQLKYDVAKGLMKEK